MKPSKSIRPAKSRARQPHRIVADEKPILGKDLEEALFHFKEYHPAKRLSRNLRTMLIDFLMYEGAVEVSYLEDLLYDLQALFALLDAIQRDNDPLAQEDG